MVVHGKNRASFVGAYHHVCLCDARQGVVDDLCAEGLPYVFDARDVELGRVDDLVDEGRLSERANDYGKRGAGGGGGGGVGYCRFYSCNPLDVVGEVLRGALDARPLVRRQDYRTGFAIARYGEGRRGRLEGDAGVLADRGGGRDQEAQGEGDGEEHLRGPE